MKDKGNSDDITLFRHAMRDVKPLAESNKIHYKNTPTRPAKKIHKEIIEPIEFHLSDHYYHTINADEHIEYFQKGLPPKTIKLIRQGKYPIDHKYDFHGYDIETARKHLTLAITQAQQHHQRCLLIVHGKGRKKEQIPVLKNHINHWLKQIPSILAFCSAIPRHGGAGAIYVLLKKMA